MVYVLGVQLPDNKLARIALTKFYGIGDQTARRLCARFQIHESCKVRALSQNQITALASFLSSPGTSITPRRLPLASPSFQPLPPNTDFKEIQERISRASQLVKKDPLKQMKIELELRTEMQDNIAHQRMIGSYVGKRHAMGLPVRGQNTQTNAKTARKLNRINRYN
ncbi:hypothetical protein PLICRDRAFT_140553 [Plicaturopsis crispa FD-325 SS-3]|nr:hypothetical protein PLICRDRAFT_140553 [Plicaturopsis crispa FD-325 SS-3]